MQAEAFEPVFLTLSPARPTEYGKQWMERAWRDLDRHSNTIRDIDRLAAADRGEWDPGRRVWSEWQRLERLLEAEGVPQAISSGVSQYGMPKLIDHLNGKTAFTMPATVAMALATAAPTSTTTGATITEANYTGYARVTLAGTAFVAATAATPSISTNASAITFGNCTAGTSTLLGFILVDSATLAAGNALWYGTLTSTVISVTQTPPTVGSGVMSLSMNGT